MTLRFADQFPLWVMFAFFVVLFFASAEAGFYLGKWRQRRSQAEERGLSSTFLGAALGLLAFVLAFTFGMAGSHHAKRKAMLLEESNAIGTAYLRARLLPEPAGSEIRGLLRDYVDMRISAVQSGEIEKIRRMVQRSEAIHEQLWSKTVAVVKQASQPPLVGLFFADSLNELIDLHSKRLTAGLRTRIPHSIALALTFVAIMTMTMMGYQAGLTGVRTLVPRFALILAFASIMVLIVGLDRPINSAIQVNQQALIDLRKSMHPDRP